MKNEKEIKAIELLIEGNKFQDAVHKINELAYSYLDKDIDCNFMHDISTTFAVKETIMNLIDDEYKISKRSKIKIDDIKEDTFYYWELPTMNTIKISGITKEKLIEILDSIKEFLVDYSRLI